MPPSLPTSFSRRQSAGREGAAGHGGDRSCALLACAPQCVDQRPRHTLRATRTHHHPGPPTTACGAPPWRGPVGRSGPTS
eukprot:14162747-Alexandrium_andersonii.AAC.1